MSTHSGIAPKTIYLKDYQAPAYTITHVNLDVQVFQSNVHVHATLTVKKCRDEKTFRLYGQNMILKKITLNDECLTEDHYQLDDEGLTLTGPKDLATFTLGIHTIVDPFNNTALEGLYESNGMLCTQCEAEGFRRITYYPDQPDVMAVFTTRLEADQKQYPILLANGNMIEHHQLDHGRHSVVWHDPFPKPSYLFAMVAGDLKATHDQFKTCSGRVVNIVFYTEAKDQDKVGFAIEALKKSMAWDEHRYGREYDLDIYMVVAVSHFNMGAMENKGLNIFNSRCVLASADTATDQQYARVESIIAHEYFHNWSGNRVTCRDWFQLSLKEGFTVFRDQHFSMEVDSWLEHRVDAVKVMRSMQFAEDAGPMAHPVRPQEYIEINNFYTVTVYDKGAEVVRMIHTILGPDLFRQGTDRYFERFDGQAVTTEDFVASVTEGTNFDTVLFQRWYDQPGTPHVNVSRFYDARMNTLTLRFEQSYPALPHWKQDRLPVPIPIRLGLVSPAGGIELHTADEVQLHSTTDGVFLLKEAVGEITLTSVPVDAVPSLLRGFSAPVVLKAQYSQHELARLMAYDEDLFNRWDSAQQLLSQVILDDMPMAPVIDALGTVLADSTITPETKALICEVPAVSALEQMQVQATGLIEIDKIIVGRDRLQDAIAEQLQGQWLELIAAVDQQLAGVVFNPNPEHRGLRALRRCALDYLARLKTDRIVSMLEHLYWYADNITDRITALRCVVHQDYACADALLSDFSTRFGDEGLAMDAWFAVQVTHPGDQCLALVKELQKHKAYDAKSPNHVRAVVGHFTRGNPRQFHRLPGDGYAFLADTVLEYNTSNPQLAARLLGPLTGWRRYELRQDFMKAQLERILNTGNLSADVYEVVSKSLGESPG